MVKQLSDQDALYLYLETDETPAHVGGVSLVELPDGYRGDFFADYRATIASRMPLIPFMHSKLRALPLDIDRPFWVEDQNIDLDHHIKRLTLSKPGTFADLEALVARIHAEPLDLGRPLWEFTVIDGLPSGQLAIYTKMHHAVMDGVTSQALVTTMYDPTPAPRTFPTPAVDPRNLGTIRNLVRGVLAHRAQQAIRAVQFVPELVTALTHVALPDPATLRYRPIPWMHVAPTTLLNAGITRDRVYAARTLPLAAAKQIAKLTATTVNDVILALCCGALRSYLDDKNALPDRSLVAMVPISQHPSEPSSPNHNALLLCSLASDVADPCERLLAIHRSSLEQKQGFEVFKSFPVPDVTLPGLGAVVRRLVSWYGRSRFVGRPPWLGNLVISNITGPPVPLYIAGAKIVSMYPCSAPFHGQAVNITVESYCDRLDFGLVACRRAVPDVAILADRLPAALAELQQAVAHRAAAPGPAVASFPRPPEAVIDAAVTASGKSKAAGVTA